ncbi:MAG: ATP-binding cassette domain-containing protein [Deltaproteobacteria bacterium]|nr:ATP-binding cassette domain-containing protein [Deltaproteobacteria bacterium]
MAQTFFKTYKRLLTYSKAYAFRIGLAMVASILVAGTDVFLAKMVQPFVDDIIQTRNWSLVHLIPVIIIGIYAVRGVARFIQEYFIRTSGQLVVQDIRNDVFSHSLGLSMKFYTNVPIGNLISRIVSDAGILQRSAAQVLVEGVRESFALIGLICLAFYTDWKLACVAFLVLPVAIIPGTFIGRKIKNYTRKGQAEMGIITSVLQEAYSGIKIIKSFATEKQEAEKFFQKNNNFYHFIRKVLKYDSATAPIVEILASFGIAGVLWYGLNRVMEGAISVGYLFSFLTAIVMMYNPLKRLTKVFNRIQESLGAAERVFEILDEVPDVVDCDNPIIIDRAKGNVVFKNVSFSYEKDKVLDDFTVSAIPGEIVALVGPSGSGKTTAVGLLSRFYDLQEGAIYIDDIDIRKVSLASLKKNIALVDQESFLFNETVANNIRYGNPEASLEAVQNAAKMAYADEFIYGLPNGYEEVIGDRGVRLSGGQRQRICIARALLVDAPILVLDEATSALDTESENIVQKALYNLMKNRTTFVIAHRLSTILNAHKIIVMENGKVQESGKHLELLEQNGLYAKLYSMQFES